MTKEYRVIVADPPWSYPPSRQAGRFARDNKDLKPSRSGWFWEGDVLTEDQLMELSPLSMEDSCLFMWCTASNIPMALRVMGSWGFKYKTTLVWIKTSMNGKPRSTGMGYWSFVVHEMLLFGIKGKFQRDSKSAPFPSTFFAQPPKGEAKKPDCIYDVISEVYSGPRLEMFATVKRYGWDSHGRL